MNGIAPGQIADTPGTTKLALGFTKDDAEEMIAERVPMGYLGKGFDIAMSTIYLTCNVSEGYVSGDVLEIDGAKWFYKTIMIPREMVAELSRKVEAKRRELCPKMASTL